MKNNFEQAPAAIFDWIEQHDFDALSPAQQQLVLVHFEKEEYNDMYRVALELGQAPKCRQNADQSKQLLLDRFDRHHGGGKVVRLFAGPALAWQAAAAVLFVLSGWLLYHAVGIKYSPLPAQMAVHDTVFVDREVKGQPEIIHDTVVYYKMVSSGKIKPSDSPQISAGRVIEEFENTEELQEVELDELDNEANSLRHNSMKDDSLVGRFGFISL